MAPPSSSPPRVLIAERDRNVRALEEYFLTGAGFAVEFCDDGQAALEEARRDVPSLLVAEILLPKLDGLSLCRAVREDPGLRDLPVLIFSILAAEQRARDAGASAFLRKPLVDSIFLAAVRSLVATPHSGVVEEQWASK